MVKAQDDDNEDDDDDLHKPIIKTC